MPTPSRWPIRSSRLDSPSTIVEQPARSESPRPGRRKPSVRLTCHCLPRVLQRIDRRHAKRRGPRMYEMQGPRLAAAGIPRRLPRRAGCRGNRRATPCTSYHRSRTPAGSPVRPVSQPTRNYSLVPQGCPRGPQSSPAGPKLPPNQRAFRGLPELPPGFPELPPGLPKLSPSGTRFRW